MIVTERFQVFTLISNLNLYIDGRRVYPYKIYHIKEGPWRALVWDREYIVVLNDVGVGYGFSDWVYVRENCVEVNLSDRIKLDEDLMYELFILDNYPLKC